VTLTASLVILAIGIALTLALIGLVRRFVPVELRGHEERRGWVFAFCGVLYALVVGFVLAFALNGHQSASSQTNVEADSVTALSRTATLFDAESRDRIGHELICYARSVIEDEWPAMAEGRSSVLASAASDRLFQSFGRLGRSNPNQAALETSLDRVRDLGEARAGRLLMSHQSLPPMFWVFMIGGGLILIAYATVLAGRERLGGQIMFILPVTLLLLCSIYLVAAFEKPFREPNAIAPRAMQVALESVTSFVPDPRADRPCP